MRVVTCVKESFVKINRGEFVNELPEVARTGMGTTIEKGNLHIMGHIICSKRGRGAYRLRW
jgi:hypothetical protein